MQYTSINLRTDFHTGCLRKEREVVKLHLDRGMPCPWISGGYVDLDVLVVPLSVVLGLVRSGCKEIVCLYGI